VRGTWALAGCSALSLLCAPLPAGAATRALAFRAHADPPACGSSVRVVVWSDYASYARGTPVTVTALVRNGGSTSCSVALGPSSPLVSVSSSAGLAWRSCGVSSPCALYLQRVTLAPGAFARRSVVWDQRVHSQLAARATYYVRASLGPLTSAPVSLRLARATNQRTVLLTSLAPVTRVSMTSGASLVLALPARGAYVWSTPMPSGALATRVALGGTSTLAIYRATRPGLAQVSVAATPRCYPECLAASLIYRILVTVT
jgi:hypothetical protein